MNNMNFKQCEKQGVGMKKMLLIVLLMLSVGWVFADTINVGTGTEEIVGAPIDFSKASGWSRTIYLDSELNFTDGTEITNIQYHYSDPNYTAMMMLSYDIYLKQVVESSYDGDENMPDNLLDAGYSLVKSDFLVGTNSKPSMDIALSNSYVWDSAKPANLEVVWVVDNAPMPALTTAEFKSTTVGNNRTLFNWAEGVLTPSNHIPYITITYKTPPTPAEITKLSPANGAKVFSNSVTFKWGIGEGDIMPTGYKLYYAQGTGVGDLPVAPIDIPNGNTTEFTVSSLSYDQNYVWSLVPYNAEGDCPGYHSDVWTFSIGAKTTSWVGDFSPGDKENWRHYVGLPTANNLVLGEQWGFESWLNQGSGSAAVMKFGSPNQIAGWLVSPVINIPADKEVVLKLDIGLTNAGTSGAISNPNGQEGYKFAVYLSEHPDMGGSMGKTLLAEWNNSGSDFVFNEILHTGATDITIPFYEYGYRYIGIYAEAGFDKGSVDLFIDNIKIEEVQEPELEVHPSSLDFGYLDYEEKVTRNITVTNSGGGTLTLNSSNFSITGSDQGCFSFDSNINISLGAGLSTTVPVHVKSIKFQNINATLKVGVDSEYGVKEVSLTAFIMAEPEADEIMHGRGTNNHGLPANVTRKNNLTQTIIKKEDLDLKYKQITGLSFEWNGGNSEDTQFNMNICLQETDKVRFDSSSDWINTSSGDAIAAPTYFTISNTGGRRWIDIPFIDGRSFVSSGTKNYVITIATDMHLYSSTPGYFLNTETPGNDYPSITAWRTSGSFGLDMPNQGDNLGRLRAFPNMKFKFEKTVDILPDEKDVAIDKHDVEATFSMTGESAANILPLDGAFPDFPNENVKPENSNYFNLQIFGGDHRTITIRNSGFSFASYYGTSGWVTSSGGAKNSNGSLVLDIPGTIGQTGQIFNVILSNEDPTLPVELSHFSVTLSKQNHAVINWTTQSETGVNGFYIYKNMQETFNEAELISGLIPATNSSNETKYSFTDKELYQTGVYYYWLMVLDINGTEDVVGPLTLNYEIEDGPEGVVPVVTTIKSIYPNPFNPSTTIAYSLKDKEDVNIYVYNTRGQLVSSIDRGKQDVGHYEYVWHGTNNNGQRLSSGVYFIRLKAGKTIVNKKAVLMK